MKKLILFFCFTLFNVLLVFGQCDHSSSVGFSSQEDFDDFFNNYCSTTFEGWLGIGNGIHDLSAMQTITFISGGLNISSNSLENLEGLGNIDSISSNFTLSGNGNLKDLTGLENLKSIGGNFEIVSNNNMVNFEGLNNLTNIEREFTVKYNDNLNSFKGLDNLSKIGEAFTILFDHGTEDSFTNFVGLENLNSIGGSLSLHRSPSIINFEGLTNLIAIEGGFFLSDNSKLRNFEGLENLNNIGGTLYLEYGLEMLTNFNGLESLRSVGELNIFGLSYIQSFSGLESLTSINGKFRVNGAEISNFIGLENLESVGSISLAYNHNLKNFIGLEKLNSINGNVFDSPFSVRRNDNLESFEGLENLSFISHESDMVRYFVIDDNPSLESLIGLGNLNFSGEMIISVYDNTVLETCCQLIPFFDLAQFYNNAPSCNSIDSIYLHCIEKSIQAQAFHDENENGIFDNTEKYLVQNFSADPQVTYGFVDETGINYLYFSEEGAYTIFYDEISPLWTIDPNYNNVEIEIQDSIFQDTIFYFPLTKEIEIARQDIDLTSSITRCNRETNYWLTYANKGTVNTSGIVELESDELASFISSDPPPDSTANGKLFWFYNDLYPTYSNKIKVIYEMPGVDDLGEIIDFEAGIQTNEGYADHKAVLSSELICAYDPNDKLSTPSGHGDENYTLFNDTLEYTIRFQNTGNDTAFNVEIRDELSELLNLNTFKPIASSHNVETKVDIESRIATFKFQDIYLPDSFVNEPASHGFVKYQILGKEGLSENSDVKNTASIYFDHNPAIVTNTVNNRMVSKLPTLPVISANPSELDFGTIDYEESEYLSQILTINNLGELPLNITEFIFNDAVFSSGEIQNLTIEGLSNSEIAIHFTPTTEGDYQSELILKSNAGDLNINLNGIAPKNTLDNSKVHIYPNPNNGKFTIYRENLKSYIITNSLGETVSYQKATGDQLEIDLSAESRGLYFISLKTEDAVIVERVVIY